MYKMVNNNSAISNVAGSSFNGQPPSTIIPCTIVSTRTGVTHRNIWNTAPIPGITPGSDANNLNTTFSLRDSYGLPAINVASAPNIDDYIAGAQTGNTAGFAACIADCWISVPVGINTIQLQSRTFGVHNSGAYVGKALRYMNRVAWNTGFFTTANIDISDCKILCGQRIVALRAYVCNGYFNWGFFWQWNIGAGFVDIPVANTHGEQPSQSYWPG